MLSPLAKWYNCIISVENADSTLIVDDNGNTIASGGTTSEYKLYLKEPEDWSKRQHYYQETTDGQHQFLEGYVVEPIALPQHVKLPQRFVAKFQITPGAWQDCELECRARLVPISKTQVCTGQAIEGYLRWNR